MKPPSPLPCPYPSLPARERATGIFTRLRAILWGGSGGGLKAASASRLVHVCLRHYTTALAEISNGAVARALAKLKFATLYYTLCSIKCRYAIKF